MSEVEHTGTLAAVSVAVAVGVRSGAELVFSSDRIGMDRRSYTDHSRPLWHWNIP